MRPTMRRIVVLVGGLRPRPFGPQCPPGAAPIAGRMAGMAARMGVGRDTTPVGPLDTDCRERGLVGSIRERPVAGTTEVPFAPGRPLFPCCRWGPCDDGPTPCAHPRNVGLFIARRFVGEDRRAVDRVRGDGGDDKRYASPEARPRDRGCWRIVRHSGLLPPAAAVPARDDRSCATGPGPSTRRSFLWVLWQKSSWPFAISHIIICANHV